MILYGKYMLRHDILHPAEGKQEMPIEVVRSGIFGGSCRVIHATLW
jgi:hypothetical protein